LCAVEVVEAEPVQHGEELAGLAKLFAKFGRAPVGVTRGPSRETVGRRMSTAERDLDPEFPPQMLFRAREALKQLESGAELGERLRDRRLRNGAASCPFVMLDRLCR